MKNALPLKAVDSSVAGLIATVRFNRGGVRAEITSEPPWMRPDFHRVEALKEVAQPIL